MRSDYFPKHHKSTRHFNRDYEALIVIKRMHFYIQLNEFLALKTSKICHGWSPASGLWQDGALDFESEYVSYVKNEEAI